MRPSQMREDYASKPDAAESPAPATAIICFDDDNSSLNAVMSEDGREDIFWSLKGGVVGMRETLSTIIESNCKRVLRSDPRMMASPVQSTKFDCRLRLPTID